MNEEFVTQTRLVAWMKKKGIFFCHVPNETKPGKFLQSKKMLGLIAGMPDLIIFDPPPLGPTASPGAIIEVKSSKGKLSVKQQNILEMFKNRNWQVVVIRSYSDGVDWLMKMGY